VIGVLLAAAGGAWSAGCASRQSAAPTAEAEPARRFIVHAQLSRIEDELVMAGLYVEAIGALRGMLRELTRPGAADEGWENELRARTLLWLGWCLELTAGPGAAAAEYLQLIELYPDGPAADQARRLLEGLTEGIK
jgi:hypothetical protein